MPREVTDAEGTTWSCVPPYQGLSGDDSMPEAARVEGSDDLYQLVCTPSGGAQSVRIEVPGDWATSLSDEDLVARIGAAAREQAEEHAA
jgi:hypothetical protein